MANPRDWTDKAWETYRKITEADDPRRPWTSVLARVRERFLTDRGKWFPILDELDEVLFDAALEVAPTFDEKLGSLYHFFSQAAQWRATDALNEKYEDCPACLRRSPNHAAEVTEICVLCRGHGRVWRDYAVNRDDGERTARITNREPTCPACQGGEVGGRDCVRCGGTGKFLPVNSDELVHESPPWLSPEMLAKADNRLFEKLKDKLPGRLPDPLHPEFVCDLADTVRKLSEKNKLQMLLDEQVFSTENRRTASDDLQQLAEWLDMTPEAIRTARGRLRTRLREVFECHGVKVPESLLKRKAAATIATESDDGAVKEASNPPRSPVFHNKPTPRRPCEGHP